MASERSLTFLLRNVSVRNLERALRRDGFEVLRTAGSSRIYAHPDGRATTLHYHHGSDTLAPGTLRSILTATRWTEDDARRLRLL